MNHSECHRARTSCLAHLQWGRVLFTLCFASLSFWDPTVRETVIQVSVCPSNLSFHHPHQCCMSFLIALIFFVLLKLYCVPSAATAADCPGLLVRLNTNFHNMTDVSHPATPPAALCSTSPTVDLPIYNAGVNALVLGTAPRTPSQQTATQSMMALRNAGGTTRTSRYVPRTVYCTSANQPALVFQTQPPPNPPPHFSVLGYPFATSSVVAYTVVCLLATTNE